MGKREREHGGERNRVGKWGRVRGKERDRLEETEQAREPDLGGSACKVGRGGGGCQEESQFPTLACRGCHQPAIPLLPVAAKSGGSRWTLRMKTERTQPATFWDRACKNEVFPIQEALNFPLINPS